MLLLQASGNVHVNSELIEQYAKDVVKMGTTVSALGCMWVLGTLDIWGDLGAHELEGRKRLGGCEVSEETGHGEDVHEG